MYFDLFLQHFGRHDVYIHTQLLVSSNIGPQSIDCKISTESMHYYSVTVLLVGTTREHYVNSL